MKTFIFERSELDCLVETLKRRGYKVIGPILRDSAIIYDELTDTNDLPVGWTDEQTNASYRLKNRNDAAVFGWTVGPQSWKKFLFPPIQKIFATHFLTPQIDDEKLEDILVNSIEQSNSTHVPALVPRESRHAFIHL